MKDALPEHMPLLPLPARVMLPASVLQVRMPASLRSVSLAEYLVSRPAQASYVAVVPVQPKDGTVSSKAAKDAGNAAAMTDISSDSLLDVGTAARIVQVARSPQHGDWTLTLEGVCRVHIGALTRDEGHQFYTVSVAAAESAGSRSHEAAWDKQVDLLHKQVSRAGAHLFNELQQAVGVETAPQAARALGNLPPAHVADLFLNLLATTLQDRLEALQAVDLRARLRFALELIRSAREQLKAVAEAAASGNPSEVASKLVNHPALRAVAGPPRTQRGPGALGRGPLRVGVPGGAGKGSDDDDDEVAELMKKLKEANPPPEVIKAAMREAKKLQGGAQGNPGSSTARTYLEVLADMPWNTFSHTKREKDADAQGLPRTLAEVRLVLDDKHYGLDKVKDRIVQYVAVRRLRGWDAKAPILCFIGPPGVGKTSLAKSVAEVLVRPLHRISLGGVRDEAEIRGHRRTYVGALPGRIIQGLRRCGVADPVLLLDEVDKMGRDVRGDPAAALLEVLDPEQNHAFVDHYLAVAFDLSKVVFVATANEAATIPPPLLDRMEVIQLSGYTLEEKLHIAMRHLLPKLLLEHGLLPTQIQLSEDVLSHIIQHYTREAGVRSLSRCLSAILRHAAVQIVTSFDLNCPQPAPPSSPSSEPDSSTQDIPSASAAHCQARAGASSAAAAQSIDVRSTTAAAAPHAVTRKEQMHGRETGLSAVRNGAGLTGSAEGSGDAERGCVDPLCSNDGWQDKDCCDRQEGAQGPAACDCSATGTAREAQAEHGDSTHSYWDRLLMLLGMSRSAVPRGVTRNDTRAHLQPSGWASKGISRSNTSASLQLFPAAVSSCSSLGLYPTQVAQARQAAWLAAQSDPATHSDSAAGHCPDGMQLHMAQETAIMHRRGAGPFAEAAVLSGPRHVFDITAAEQPLALARRHDMAGHRGWGALQEAGSVLGPLPALGSLPDAEEGVPGPAVFVVDVAMVEVVLGPPKFEGNDASDMITAPGSAAGLVWTSAGGLVQYVECCAVGEGSAGHVGKLTLTGSMGEVLQESSHIALSWVRAHASRLGIPQGGVAARTWDVHVHLPTGAVPKDGPSAGITLACALVSLFTGRCCRADTAMTGELSLRGLVLPVGGIKEKLLAAYTAGMRRVLLSKRNERDVLAHVPTKVLDNLQVVYCESLPEVLREAFDPPLIMEPSSKL